MMGRTKIDYLTHTWNPIAMRCSKLSDGCTNCWHLAMCRRMAENPRLSEAERKAYAGGTPELRETELGAPLRVKKPAIIGVQFMGDLFHPDVPVSFIAEVFDTMASWALRCKKRNCEHDDPDCFADPGHTYLVLTKRPERMHKVLADELNWYAGEYMPGDCALSSAYEAGEWPLRNVMLGVSIEDQATADERIPWLLRTPATKRFVSYEPALGPVDFTHVKHGEYVINPLTKEYGTGTAKVPFHSGMASLGGLDLVIAGGETGPGARPAHPDWFRSVRDQCQAAGVAFFLKSLGEWMTKDNSSPNDEMWPPFKRVHCWNPEKPSFACAHHDWAYRVGKKAAGRMLDGREWNEWPTT